MDIPCDLCLTNNQCFQRILRLRITKDVAQGLKYAGGVQYQGNALQLVHRDLKPANILVNRQGQSKIVDFGLAHALGD